MFYIYIYIFTLLTYAPPPPGTLSEVTFGDGLSVILSAHGTGMPDAVCVAIRFAWVCFGSSLFAITALTEPSGLGSKDNMLFLMSPDKP